MFIKVEVSSFVIFRDIQKSRGDGYFFRDIQKSKSKLVLRILEVLFFKGAQES